MVVPSTNNVVYCYTIIHNSYLNLLYQLVTILHSVAHNLLIINLDMSNKTNNIHNNTQGERIMERQIYGNGPRVEAMPIERRQSPRENCNCKQTLIIGGQEVEADLRNISRGGAFFHLAEKDNDIITSADTGKTIIFRLSRGDACVNRKGYIDRYTEDNNNKYLAVVFSNGML